VTVTVWLCKENYGGQEESSEEGCKEGEEGKEEDEEVAFGYYACLILHESCMKRSRKPRPLLLSNADVSSNRCATAELAQQCLPYVHVTPARHDVPRARDSQL
jgi:hypothetical protein